jgi:hypothetical protein
MICSAKRKSNDDETDYGSKEMYDDIFKFFILFQTALRIQKEKYYKFRISKDY